MRFIAMDAKDLVKLLESDIIVGVQKSTVEADPYIERVSNYGKMLHADDQGFIGRCISRHLAARGVVGWAGRDREWAHLSESLQETSRRKPA